ncbi:MAG: hypothetical protein ACI88Z_000313, partial [Sphingobacteriales bacterium]
APVIFKTIAGAESSGSFSGITSGSQYSFWVKAVSRSGKESESNRILITPKFTSFPTAAYISNIRPNGNQTVDYDIFYKGSAEYALLKVYKGFGGGKELVIQTEGAIDPILPVKGEHYDSRFALDPFTISAEITNKCPEVLLESNKMSVGVISLEKSAGQISVSVGEVSGFENGIGETKIYKIGIDPVTLEQTFTWVSNSTNFVDTDLEGSQHCYIADVIENGQNSTGIQGEVRLFPQCSFDLEEIDFPNAFVPGGSVPKFNPFFTINGFFTGSLKIYSRYGGEIYSEEHSFDKPGQGWDGNYKGSKVPPGAYIYFLKFADDIQGESHKKTGVVYIF